MLHDLRLRLSAEELAHVASSTSLRIDVLSRSERPSSTRHVGVDGMWSVDVTELSASVAARGQVEKGNVAVLAVVDASSSTISRIRTDRARIIVIPGGVEFGATIAPGLRYVTVVFPVEDWQRLLLATNNNALPGDPADAFSFALDDGAASQLPVLVAELEQDLSHLPGKASALPSCLEDYLGTIMDTARSPVASIAGARTTAADRKIHEAFFAAEYIQRHLQEDIGIVKLCAVAGVSRRQLEYAFRELVGMGPKRYIYVARLNAARRMLLDPDQARLSVTDAALEAGIMHLGRFASDYKALFGELPSDTRQRTRRR